MNQRVIKFRAWDKINHKWLFGDEGLTIQQIAALNYHELPIHGKDIEWLEYTGLLDKNGNEIYEKNIVKIECDIEPKEIIDYVVFREGQFMTGNCYVPIAYNVKSEVNYATKFMDNYWEVIGNIYENHDFIPQV